jgi:hypothetical protein
VVDICCIGVIAGNLLRGIQAKAGRALVRGVKLGRTPTLTQNLPDIAHVYEQVIVRMV